MHGIFHLQANLLGVECLNPSLLVVRVIGTGVVDAEFALPAMIYTAQLTSE